MSQDHNHLNHATWECKYKYHVVFTPKYRKRRTWNASCGIFWVTSFWARGYFVSTIGRDEEMIRAYIRNQEMADKQLDQLQLKLASS